MRFEDGVIRHLKEMRCQTSRSALLDHEKKTDFEVHDVNGSRLRLPARVQITLRLAETGKLADFLEANADHAGTAIYVEATDCSAWVVANHLKEFLETCGRRRRIVMRISGHEMRHLDLTPQQQQDILKAKTQRKVLTGGITGKRGGRLHVRGADGRSYEAEPINVRCRDLQPLLSSLSRDERLQTPIFVRFVPAFSEGRRQAKEIELVDT